MSKIEKILKENMEEYESARRSALGFIHENKKDLAKNYEYASKLTLPLEEEQAFFFIDEKKPGSELLKDMLKYLGVTDELSGGIIACIKDGRHVRTHSDVTWVKEGSPEYDKALATSEFIFSNAFLPVCFVKREGQVYFNAMLEVYEMDDLNTVEFISTVTREFLKTDYIYAPSKGAARKAWLEKSAVGRVYGGKVLVSDAKEGELAEFLVNRVIDSLERTGVESISLREGAGRKKEEPQKKKVLFISSWKGNQKNRSLVRKFLEGMDPEAYDVAIYSGCLNAKEDCREFLALLESVTKIMGNGRMVLTEEEFFIYRMIEKNPVTYLENEEVRSFVDERMRREWGRLFGRGSWDVVVWAGCDGYLPYYLAAGGTEKVPVKVLVDLDFLPYIREKHPTKWNRAVTVFHRIYAPADCLLLGNYGLENRLRVKRLPVLPADPPEGEVETVSYNGLTYLICDKWNVRGDRTAMKLVEKPVSGSFLVNGDEPPSKEREEMLKQLEKNHKLYILGAQSRAYGNFLKDGVILDEYVRKELYLLPTAWEFFGAFDGYVGTSDLEEDVTGKICKAFHVAEIVL